jgi:hypothetical protein
MWTQCVFISFKFRYALCVRFTFNKYSYVSTMCNSHVWHAAISCFDMFDTFSMFYPGLTYFLAILQILFINTSFDCMKNFKFFKFIYFAMASNPWSDIRFIQCCTYVLNLKYFKLKFKFVPVSIFGILCGNIGIYLNSFLFYIAVGALQYI